MNNPIKDAFETITTYRLWLYYTVCMHADKVIFYQICVLRSYMIISQYCSFSTLYTVHPSQEYPHIF